MIKRPEKGTRNVNDMFYEAESRRIDIGCGTDRTRE